MSVTVSSGDIARPQVDGPGFMAAVDFQRRLAAHRRKAAARRVDAKLAARAAQARTARTARTVTRVVSNGTKPPLWDGVTLRPCSCPSCTARRHGNNETLQRLQCSGQ